MWLCQILCPLQQEILTSVKDIELCCISLKLDLGNVVFLCRGRWWTFIGSSRHLLGDLRCVGVCSRECVCWARQERPWRGAEVEPERDCLATAGSLNVSLTKKSWMSYDEGSAHTLTHTHSSFQSSVCAHKRTSKHSSGKSAHLLIHKRTHTQADSVI